MWNTLENISEQVTKYSSFLGKLWYVLVFLFRLIVVATVGNAVYSDEQSAFKCSEDVVGCTNMCYNQFAKISHMRFWAFQLLAVTTPTVFFHFYSTHVSGEIEKLKNSEDDLKQMENGDRGHLTLATSMSEGDVLKMTKRMKSIGEIKVRKIYSNNELKEIPYTNKIKRAYFLSTILRILIEGLFMYFAYLTFQRLEPRCDNCVHALSFLWLTVPGSYHCEGLEQGTRDACSQHIDSHGNGFVPCFVSRPFEKTIFLRYMMILSAACFVISVVELFVLSFRKLRKIWLAQQKVTRRHCSEQGSVFCSPPPSAPHHYEDNNFYPSIAVPVKIGNKGSRKNTVLKSLSSSDDEKDGISMDASLKIETSIEFDHMEQRLA